MRGKNKHPFLTALLVFAVAIAGVYVYHTQDDGLTKDQIYALVENNAAALEAIAQSEEPSQMKKTEGVKKISVVDGVVEFSCGGIGTGKDTVYMGFYYSPDGMPDAVCRGVRFADAANLRAGGQGFVVQNGQGGQYYTQHIVGNFYYYEANF